MLVSPTQSKNGAYKSWLPQSNYRVNYKIPGDFEVFDFDEKKKIMKCGYQLRKDSSLTIQRGYSL